MQRLAGMILKPSFSPTFVKIKQIRLIQKWCLSRNAIMMMIDLVINIDSLLLQDGESVDDMVDKIQEEYDIGYPITYEVTHEEIIDD